MVRLAQVLAGILVATVGIGGFTVAIGRSGPQAAGKPADQPAAQVPESWVGKKVVTKYSDRITEGDRIVDADGHFRAFTVNDVSGRRLRLVCQGISGWIDADRVVLADRAIDYYTEEIRKDPKNANAYYQRALIWSELRKEPEKAISDCTEAIRIDPRSWWGFYHLRGILLDYEDQLDGALADYTEAIRIEPGIAQVHHLRADIWHRKGDQEKAITDYGEAIRLDPNDAASYSGRGRAQAERHEYDKAIADLTEAIRLDHKDATTYYARGRAYHSLGDDDKAIPDYDRAIELDPEEALSYFARGVSRGSIGEFDPALDDFNHALRLDPQSVDARAGRAWLWPIYGEYDKAIAEFNEVIRLDPRKSYAYRARAWIWATSLDAKIRDGQRAVESATKACELTDWKDAGSLETLAAANAEAGDFDSAVKWQEKSITVLSGAKAKAEGDARLKLYRENKPYHAELP
jgi:tetratricopeptide (TPR) repeat protein